MTKFIDHLVIDTDPVAAAAVFLDWTQDPSWRSAVLSMTATPRGAAVPGQRLVERLKTSGLTFVTPTTIIDVTDSAATFTGGSALISVAGTRSITAVGDGSRIAMDIEIRFHPALRLVERALAGSYARRQRADLDRLAALLRPSVVSEGEALPS